MQVAKLLISVFLSVFALQANAIRIVSNGSGPFTSGSTWQGGIVPGPVDTAVIRHTDSVTLANQVASVMALVIEPQGKLAMWTGTLLVSDSLLNLGFMAANSASSVTILGSPNKGVVNRGTLRIGFGTTWVLGEANFCNRLFLSTGQIVINPNSVTRIYGRTRMEAGQLTQDGGQVFFYGNSGVAATSVAATDNIVFMDATGFGCTAGSMTVADAHHESFFPMINTVEITGNNPQAFSGSHTWYMGDAISTKPAHPNRGITLGNGQKNGMKAPVNHLWVQTKFIGSRFFYTSITPNSGTYVNGDFKVVFQSEARHVWVTGVEMAIGGDLEIDDGSFFTNSQPIYLGAADGYTIAKKQVVFSSGTIREDVVNPAFHFGALVFNNSLTGDTAVRFTAGSTIKVRDSVVFLAGVAAMHSLQLGNENFMCKTRVENGGIIPAAANATPVNIARFYRQTLGGSASFGSGFDVFPFASATDFAKRTLQIQFQQVIATGSIIANYNDGIGSETANPAIQGTDNGVFCNTLSRQFWYLNANGGLSGSGLQVRCTGGNLILDGNTADLRLHKLGTAIAGTSNGGGTLQHPVATKTNLNTVNDANGSYYLAGNDNLLVTKIPSIASGAAENPANWKYNRVPDQYYGAIVKNGHQISYGTAPTMQVKSLDIEAGGTMLLSKNAGTFTVIRKTMLQGLLEVNAACTARLSKVVAADTSLYIGNSGNLRLSHPQALVVLYHGLSNAARIASMVNFGTLDVAKGQVDCLGFMHHLGNSDLYLGNEAKLFITGGGAQPMHTQPMLLIATTGKVEGNKGTIQFADAPDNANQLTLLIQRNTLSNINLTQCTFECGVLGTAYNTGNGLGASVTGYKLETNGGAVNVPIGLVVVRGQNILPGENRFVRNGDKGLFLANGLFIYEGALAHFFPSVGENIIGGKLSNFGRMVSEGKLIFGGTESIGGNAFIEVNASNNESNRFANALTNPTANFNDIEIRHWGKSVRTNFAMTVAGKLILTRGFLYPTKDLTLGTGTGNTGELQITHGRLLAGEPYVFYRWYSTGTINPGSVHALYPFAIEGFDRMMYLSGTPLAGGTVGIRHFPSSELSAEFPPLTEAGSTVNRGFLSLWQGIVGNGYSNANIGLRIEGGGFAVKQPDKVRLLNTNYGLIAGSTHLSAGGDSSRIVVERTGLTPAMLVQGIRFGVPGAQTFVAIRSVQSGNWSNAATWNCQCIPFAPNSVAIDPGHQVTLQPNSGNNLSVTSITIYDNAVLEIKGDTLKTAFLTTTAQGELRITGGVIMQSGNRQTSLVYFMPNTKLSAGKYRLGSTAATALPGEHDMYMMVNGYYEQSGGELYSEYPIVAPVETRMNVSGGRMYIQAHSRLASIPHFSRSSALTIQGSANPAFSKTFTNSTLVISNPLLMVNATALSVAGPNISFANHNLMLGDTTLPVDMQESGSGGFRIQTNVKLSNIIVAGNSTVDGRQTTFDETFQPNFACDNLYITPNSEWRNPSASSPANKVYIHGNLVNEGSYTNYLATTVLGGGYNGSTAGNPQYISGSGRFRYQPSFIISPLEPIINFLEVNNLSSSGVTLHRNLKLSQLNMINGDIRVDTVQLGTSDVDWGGIIPSGTGAIIGHVRKWMRSQPDVFNIPVGVAGVRRNLKVTTVQAPNPAGLVTFSYSSAPGGAAGLPLQEGSLNLVTTAPEGFWKVSNQSAGNTFYNVEATAAALGNVTDYTQLVLLKRHAGSPNWVKEGNHATATGSNSLPTLYRSNLFGYGDIAIGLATTPVVPTLSHWTGNLSREWYNAGNWSHGIPGANTAVILPGSRPRYPWVTADVTIQSLEAQSGSALHLEAQKKIRLLGNQNP